MATIHLGTQGWSYKSWEGMMYPTGTPAGAYLPEYAKRLNAVEIDSTFYGTPRRQNITKWDGDTPPGFRFAAKFPKQITHEASLEDGWVQAVAPQVSLFLDTMSRLGDKLGPLVLQFSYEFGPDRREPLAEFLAALPSNLRYAIEVRHRGWLKDWFYQLLEQHRVALVLADYRYMPKLERATTDFAYIRWLGNRKDIPDDDYTHVRINRDQELDHWADVIAGLHEQGVSVWGFANNHYQGHSPATVDAIKQRLVERGIAV
jgi:uncharacterized protein YecE (DUF72 family)